MGSPFSADRSEELDVLVECHRRLVEHLEPCNEITSENIILESFCESLSLYIHDCHRCSSQELEGLVAVLPAKVSAACAIDSPRWKQIIRRRVLGFLVLPRLRAKYSAIKRALDDQIETQDASDDGDLERTDKFEFFDFCPLTEEEKDDFTASLAVRRRRAIACVVTEDQSQETHAA